MVCLYGSNSMVNGFDFFDGMSPEMAICDIDACYVNNISLPCIPDETMYIRILNVITIIFFQLTYRHLKIQESTNMIKLIPTPIFQKVRILSIKSERHSLVCLNHSYRGLKSIQTHLQIPHKLIFRSTSIKRNILMTIKTMAKPIINLLRLFSHHLNSYIFAMITLTMSLTTTKCFKKFISQEVKSKKLTFKIYLKESKIYTKV